MSVFVGTSHCGAGCSLADLIVEWTVFALPSIAVIGGMGWLFSNQIYATWVIAYVVALAISITFQLSAWQIGTMVAGFCTAYPVNWWLIKVGIKEPM